MTLMLETSSINIKGVLFQLERTEGHLMTCGLWSWEPWCSMHWMLALSCIALSVGAKLYWGCGKLWNVQGFECFVPFASPVFCLGGNIAGPRREFASQPNPADYLVTLFQCSSGCHGDRLIMSRDQVWIEQCRTCKDAGGAFLTLAIEDVNGVSTLHFDVSGSMRAGDGVGTLIFLSLCTF